MVMPNTKLVRVSTELENRFKKLPNKADWDPTGFPEFVREAVRAYLDEHEARAYRGIREREESDHNE